MQVELNKIMQNKILYFFKKTIGLVYSLLSKYIPISLYYSRFEKIRNSIQKNFLFNLDLHKKFGFYLNLSFFPFIYGLFFFEKIKIFNVIAIFLFSCGNFFLYILLKKTINKCLINVELTAVYLNNLGSCIYYYTIIYSFENIILTRLVLIITVFYLNRLIGEIPSFIFFSEKYKRVIYLVCFIYFILINLNLPNLNLVDNVSQKPIDVSKFFSGNTSPVEVPSEGFERKKKIITFGLGIFGPTLLFCSSVLRHNVVLAKNPVLATAIAIPTILIYSTNYMVLTGLIIEDMQISEKENKIKYPP